jgi:hypothetical protein
VPAEPRPRTPTSLKALRVLTACVVAGAVALFVATRVFAAPGLGYPVPTAHRPIVGDMTDVASDRPGIRILFVGDSLVFVNDLPRMLHRMAADDPGGPQIYTAQFGAGGGLLLQFAQDPRLRRLIDSEHWSHVVLQENSNVAGVEDRWRQYAEPAIAEIDGWARAQGAAPILFATWAYTHGYVPGDTFDAMQGRIDGEELSVGIPVVRVGDVWGAAMKMTPHPRLHLPDMVHPTAAGTYLAAAVFYRAVTGRPSAPSTYTAGLPTAQARMLRSLADRDTTPLIDVP